MKIQVILAVLALATAPAVAQRPSGNTRQPVHEPAAGSGTSQRRDDGRGVAKAGAGQKQDRGRDNVPPPIPIPPIDRPLEPPPMLPPVVVLSPTSPVVVVDPPVYARRIRGSAVLTDAGLDSAGCGFNFAEQVICGYDDPGADIIYQTADTVSLLEAPDGSDIQELGPLSRFVPVPPGPVTGWEQSRDVEPKYGYVYLVRTQEDRYFEFRVTAVTPDSVSFTYAEARRDFQGRMPPPVEWER